MFSSKTCPVPKDIIETDSRILVIGDLHADYTNTLRLLKHFKLINSNNKWIGKNTVIVQLGDQLDGQGRSYHEDASGEFKLLDLLDDLHLQAQMYGGAVYSILGNHELMNISGVFTYVSKKDMENSGGEENRREMYKIGGEMAQRFSCTRNSILKINDILFVHGGITSDIINFNTDSDKEIHIINTILRKYLNGFIETNDKELNNYFNSVKGITWERALGKDTVDCDDVTKVLKKLKANHIVVGHTPQDIINSKCDNRVWRVDVGLSSSMGNKKLSILEVTKKDGKSHFKVLY